MCGRYTISTDPARLAARFNAEPPAQLATPRFNAAPTQQLPVVLDADRSMQLLRWGLIPHWAEDASIGNKMINARAETIAQKPSFRESFRKRRCLVLADGYYEWQKIAGGKQRYSFGVTPKMPSYLVSVVAGELERVSVKEKGVDIGVGVDGHGLDAEASAGGEDTACDLATVGDQQSGDHGRNTPNPSAPLIGAFSMTLRQIASTVRVSRGSMTPSS